MGDYHNEEDLAKERIRKRSLTHPILKQYFGSTYKAVEAYWKVERELDNICSNCGGTGEIRSATEDLDGYDLEDCSSCDGTGNLALNKSNKDDKNEKSN